MTFPSLFTAALALLFAALGFRGGVGHSTLVLGLGAIAGLGCWAPSVRRFWAGAIRETVTRLRRGPDSKSAFLLVGIPMALLCLSNGRDLSSTDNMSLQLTAASLVTFGTPEFSRLLGYPNPESVDCQLNRGFYAVCSKRGIFAGTSPGMLLIALPSFAVSRLVGAELREPAALWRLGKWTSSWLAGALLALFFCLARKLGSFSGAVEATAFLGTGSALWSVIGQGLWSHGGVCLGLLVALAFTFRKREGFTNGVGIGLAFGMMFACRVTAAPIIAILTLWLYFSRRRDFLGAVVGVTIALALLALYLFALYGHPLGPQYLGAASSDRKIFSVAYFLSAFPGLLFSPGTGLLVYQPWLLLLGVGLMHKVRATAAAPKFWAGACLAAFVSQLLLYSFFIDWHGQWCWGSRYLSEGIPLLALVLVPILSHEATKTFRRTAYALGVLAFLIHLNGTRPGGGRWSEDPHPNDRNKSMSERVWNWKDPAFAYPLGR